MSSQVHRRALAALALAALVLTAGCAGFVGSTGDSPNEQAASGVHPSPNTSPDGSTGTVGKTISVGASGSVTAEPDKAVLRVAVQTTADSATAARQQLAENVSTLRQALVDAGISEENVTTEYYNIRQANERREPVRGDESARSTRYRATHAFSIEIQNVSRVGEIIQVAVDNGATDVQHVEFTLSESKQSELRDQALRRAMENARGDADVLASAAGLDIVDDHTVSTRGADVHPYRAELTAEAAAGGDGGTSIDSGPVTVTAQIQVTYNATG